MTALRPISSHHVRAVAATKYPLNGVCGHPECDRTDVTAHHIFPKGSLNSGAWFVEIDGDKEHPLPHVVGLCGHGTDGHHGDVEAHRAWIKLEDGEFVWYDRDITYEQLILEDGELRAGDNAWWRIGPLNPQPGSREGRPKRRRAKKGSAKLRAVWSVKVPLDEREDGADVLDKGFEDAVAIVEREGADITRSRYYVLADIFEWIRQNG